MGACATSSDLSFGEERCGQVEQGGLEVLKKGARFRGRILADAASLSEGIECRRRPDRSAANRHGVRAQRLQVLRPRCVARAFGAVRAARTCGGALYLLVVNARAAGNLPSAHEKGANYADPAISIKSSISREILRKFHIFVEIC